MAIISKHDRRKHTLTIFSAEHPEMGEGIIIEVAHKRPSEPILDTTLVAFHFVNPDDLAMGKIYTARQPGATVEAFASAYGLTDLELEPERDDLVADFSEFHRYSWNDQCKLDVDEANPCRFRMIVTGLTHIHKHGGELVKETKLDDFVGPWVIPTDATGRPVADSSKGQDLAFAAWKTAFFQTFQGCSAYVTD